MSSTAHGCTSPMGSTALSPMAGSGVARWLPACTLSVSIRQTEHEMVAR